MQRLGGKKCLVNSTDDAVKQTLSGHLFSYPRLRFDSQHATVFHPNIDKRKSKVSVLCGGGSGHEPFAAGFVGSGMLTASIAGSIFAAPPSTNIFYAIRRVAAHSSGGILMIIPNYTGDCLNFGIAIEKAKQSGIKVAEVIVDEDCSIPKEEQGVAGKRGLTGLLFIIKIAGSLAEEGKSLEEIAEIVRSALKNMATYAIGLTACAIPGEGPMFEMAEDEIECGMGIHGEAGYERIKIRSAKEVVSFMLKRIAAALQLKSKDTVAVIVNNFGALSQLEQGIVVYEVVQQLGEMGVEPLRVYSGVLMTSLQSAGVHLTLLRLSAEKKEVLINSLDAPTEAPRWPGCAYSVPLAEMRPIGDEDVGNRSIEKIGPQFEGRQIEMLEGALNNASEGIIRNERKLNDLDRGCGDGDCGSTLRRLAEGILQNLQKLHLDYPSSVLSELAKIAEDRMGGTSGALYCLFLTTVGKELGILEAVDNWLDVWVRVFRKGLDCLMKYGKAMPGDRTMIDTLNAACVSFERNSKSPLKEVCEKVASAAWEGCESTKNMEPRAGRASYVKQTQYLQEVDAGSYAAAVWIQEIANAIATFQ